MPTYFVVMKIVFSLFNLRIISNCLSILKSSNIIMSLKRPISTESNVLQPAKISKILFCPKDFNVKRVRLINKLSDISMDGTCVIYWMGRDQRVYDNYALLYAQGLAMDLKLPLKVVFNLVPTFLSATIRQYDFMLKGLQEVESQLRDLNIPFYLLMGDPTINIPTFVTNHNASAIVSDFSPIRIVRNWFRNVASLLGKKPDQSTSSSLDIQYRLMPFYEVDARNVIPCWITSDKLEYGARTIRPKIQSKFPEFLTEISPPVVNPFGSLDDCPLTNWINIEASLQVDRSVREVDWLVPGPSGALATLEKFIAEGLREFAIRRNDPNHSVASNLSPYIHFGQISVQRVVLRLKSLKQFAGSVDIFIEEAVVRRELAENFCYYNTHYDSIQGAPSWAQETLRLHNADVRSIVYTSTELEEGRTHDDLWNAAQLQMVQTGKMHGFLRMYWAKKILEWTPSAEEALRISIYLNDKYELDGRDPNGYTGCMWSITGVHDQGWAEREIFGKIRYMNYQGCQRKFDVKSFVSQYPPAATNAAEVKRRAAPGAATASIDKYFSKTKKS